MPTEQCLSSAEAEKKTKYHDMECKQVTILGLAYSCFGAASKNARDVTNFKHLVGEGVKVPDYVDLRRLKDKYRRAISCIIAKSSLTIMRKARADSDLRRAEQHIADAKVEDERDFEVENEAKADDELRRQDGEGGAEAVPAAEAQVGRGGGAEAAHAADAQVGRGGGAEAAHAADAQVGRGGGAEAAHAADAQVVGGEGLAADLAAAPHDQAALHRGDGPAAIGGDAARIAAVALQAEAAPEVRGHGVRVVVPEGDGLARGGLQDLLVAEAERAAAALLDQEIVDSDVESDDESCYDN
jgi:hypothetical protein